MLEENYKATSRNGHELKVTMFATANAIKAV